MLLFYDNFELYYDRICPLNFDVAVSVYESSVFTEKKNN